jgi:hypothetical protein
MLLRILMSRFGFTSIEDRFMSGMHTEGSGWRNTRGVMSAAAVRPLTSTYKSAVTLQRPVSQLSQKRPISGQATIHPERFFTMYNKEPINIGDDIPFEELFDRNERTMCATFAKFGDLSYHTPNYRVGNYHAVSS